MSAAVARGELPAGTLPLQYRVRRHFDFNGRVVKTEIENRGGTTEGVGPFLTRTTTHDVLGSPLSHSVQVDATRTLTTQLRFDGNRNLVGRDLLFTVTRGFGTPDAATFRYDYDVNGNEDATARGVAQSHDANGNLVGRWAAGARLGGLEPSRGGPEEVGQRADRALPPGRAAGAEDGVLPELTGPRRTERPSGPAGASVRRAA